jgi:Ethanolamine utilization protein EutJ (predicted chaperonin)
MSSSSNLSITGGDPPGQDPSHAHPETDRKKGRRQEAVADAKPSQGQRLTIQQDPGTGEWVYIVTDRDTGQVIARLTRDDVARLGLKSDYAAGALVKAKA